MERSLIPAAWTSGRIFLRTFWRLAQQLFHEATGAAFGLFSAYGALSAWRQWHHGRVRWLVAVAIGYALLMAWFAWDSFRSARRVP